MKIKKSSNEVQDIDSDLITVNNFFDHLVKKISVTKYGSNKELIPTFSPWCYVETPPKRFFKKNRKDNAI